MKSLLILLMLLSGVAGPAVRPSEAKLLTRGVARVERQQVVPQKVQLTTSILSQQSHTEKINGLSRSSSRLKLKLTYLNVSEQSVILHRYGGDIYYVLISKNLKQAQAQNYIYQEHYSLYRLKQVYNRVFPESTPTDEFIILKAEESYETEREVDITVNDQEDPDKSLRPGDYVLQIRVETWLWSKEKGQDLQRRWADYGYLWSDDIESLPMPLKIG